VRIDSRVLLAVVAIAVVAVADTLPATAPDPADHSIRQFLAHDDSQPAYRATRRLEAENGSRAGWLEARTEYAPIGGLRYEVIAEGGSETIRTKVLRAVLDGEREAIEQGEAARSALARVNYLFSPNGIDEDGLANVLLEPRRRERVLISGRMLLRPHDGRLVRVEGQPAKSPSFWLRNVEIVRSYEEIQGTVVPVSLTSTAEVRFFGAASLRMTYHYSEIDGRQIDPQP
jgi:hypothetical protein